MIDLVYKTVQTLMNKENNGYLSPTEFNLMAKLAQDEIYKDYFSDENKDKIRENRGITNKGYGNLDFNRRQEIAKFAAIDTLTADLDISKFTLPEDLHLIEDDGVTTTNGTVIEEVERSKMGYLSKSLAVDPKYPVYERYGKYILAYPADISQVTIKYIRRPKDPVWSYMEVMGKEMFNPASPSYQDFEVDEGEFVNLVIKILSYFSINIREGDVLTATEILKNRETQKEAN